ncbi:MAG: EAL domain-containing protein [Rubrivivax sp.]
MSDHATPQRARRPFRLTRYFLATGLVGIAIVTACLIGIYRELALRHLIGHEARSNVDLTRAFGNHIWTPYRDLVLTAHGRPREALMADPRLKALREETLLMMKGLQVVKIKIYDGHGLTVFSTDERQIGEDKSANPAYRRALAGEVVSDITFRDRFDAAEGTISNRNLIFSYIPVRATPEGAPEAVAEVYSDVTELLARQRRAEWQVVALVVALLSALYVFLYLMMRKADHIIQRQDADRAAQEAAIRHQAHHDALTGLPNRACFAQRLDESLQQALRHQRTAALLFIDLDRFKTVNDSLGHNAGDQLLQTVAERIRAALRHGDLLFRMGGDEFTVILPELSAPEDAALLARRIVAAVSVPAQLVGLEVTVGATIGIAVYPGDGDSADVLVKNADAAMYAAKASGRGTHAFYRAEMNERALRRLGLEAELQRAFRDGQFVLHYQPRVHTDTRRVVAVEALLRWTSPARGLVPAQDFIGVLEDSGLMLVVGEWVLHQACAQAKRWAAEGHGALRVSVNVSARQFQSIHFVDTMQRVLAETGAQPAQLELEVTEALLLADPEHARQTLLALRDLGVRTTIDGFGSGDSSLNVLRRFTVDSIKLHHNLAGDGPVTDPKDRAVASAIVGLARALGIAVVAEGVETEAQAAFFAGVQCDELQGYRLAEPRAAEQVSALLAQTALTATAATAASAAA